MDATRHNYHQFINSEEELNIKPRQSDKTPQSCIIDGCEGRPIASEGYICIDCTR